MKKRNLYVAGLTGLMLCLATPLPAQEKPAPKVSLTAASNPSKRAEWQKRLTLGPGDVLDFGLLEQPDFARKNVVISPDGRVTFLQAENVVATGLTVDELRSKFDEELGKFYRMPRTIITPVSYNSKKFVVLGAVVNKGVFPLNKPTTVIEAIAQAGGLEIGLFERSTVELADLGRSFLVRNGQKQPLNFEKLFQHGDLTQNTAIEPGDYLYFASAGANEIYVLGEVMTPGVVAFAQRATVISAIAQRGGFTDKAFKSRVLVVRGSLDKPETFVVDTPSILSAKGTDFKLQPRDIVYVSANPWLTAVDLIDAAARAFILSTTVESINQNVGPWITTPLIK
jgi:protein involved in polysaccharide export with SLBB domain